MKKRFQVENRLTGRVYGIYDADSEDEALDACARQQGYASFADALDRPHPDVSSVSWVARWVTDLLQH
jgi:hypothetical protein